MSIHRAARAALKALSYPDLNIQKNYQLQRQFVRLTSRRPRRTRGCRISDYAVPRLGGEVPVRIFAPSDGARRPLLLFLHGGGFVTGSVDTYHAVCADLFLRTGHTVVSVDYRLAPEHPFPAALEDCYAVAHALFLGKVPLEVSPEEITVMGDSAGGNLAAVLSLMARDRGEFLPARQILLYPMTASDHSDSAPFPSLRENGEGYLLTLKQVRDYISLYLGPDTPENNPYFAPLVSQTFVHQPRTLIVTAEFCPLRDEGEAYAHALQSAGNEVQLHRMPDALHGYFSLSPRFSVVKKTYSIIQQFLQR